MTKPYKLHKVNSAGKQTTVIRTNADGKRSFIPFDTENADYAQYLEWVAAGNTAEAAD
jgi:hypothetical protein